MSLGVGLLKSLIKFIPAKWKIREEVKAQGEGQLALGESSLDYWARLGWPPQAARYLATAFTFGVRENVAAVLEKAQQLSDSADFGERFANRMLEDPSVAGPALEASKFTTAEELRDLLGRILVADVNEPGSVSKRAVSVAQDLTPHGLVEFLKLRAATWRVHSSDAHGLMLAIGPRTGLFGGQFISFDSDKLGIDYFAFGEFQSLGLVQERPYGIAGNFEMEDGGVRLTHTERSISLRPTGGDSRLQLGNYALTLAGTEILNLFLNEDHEKAAGYFEEVCGYWKKNGWEIADLMD